MTNKLDKKCSQIIRARGYCERCGPLKYHDYSLLQCAHIYSRTYKSVRFDLLNLLCLCASCHFWAHKNPIDFGEWVKDHIGLANYTILKQRRNTIKKWTVPDMIEYYGALEVETTTATLYRKE